MTSPDTSSSKMTIRCAACGSWNLIRGDRAADGPKCGKCAVGMNLAEPLILTDETFAKTIAESEVPVLVDFYADWCGPCRMMAPYVEELAREQVGRAIIAKVNTDVSRAAAAPFGIRGIPTSIVFRGGKEVARQVGAVPKSGLEKLLATH